MPECSICGRTRLLPYRTPNDPPFFAGGRHCRACERWLQTGEERSPWALNLPQRVAVVVLVACFVVLASALLTACKATVVSRPPRPSEIPLRSTPVAAETSLNNPEDAYTPPVTTIPPGPDVTDAAGNLLPLEETNPCSDMSDSQSSPCSE